MLNFYVAAEDYIYGPALGESAMEPFSCQFPACFGIARNL